MNMNADPIWHPASTSSCIYIRQRFKLYGDAKKAWIDCAATGAFQLYVNGELALRGPGPALTPEAMWYRADIGGFLGQGENVLLVLAHAHSAAASSSWFVAQGEVAYAAGGKVEFATGRPWQVLPAAGWQALGWETLAEAHFASQEPHVWTTGAFREGNWEDAVVVHSLSCEPLSWMPNAIVEGEVWAKAVVQFGEVDAGGDLEFAADPGPMRQCKCVRREAVLHMGKNQALVQTRDVERAVYLVLDFGRLVTGFPRLRLRSRGENVVDMGFARRRGRIDGGLRYLSREGLQEWTGLELQSCRYIVLRLSHCEDGLELDCVSLVERRVELAEESRIKATDELQQIWRTGARSLAACRQEIYHFGTGGRAYDWLRAYVLALNDYYLTGDARTAGATLVSQGASLPSTAEIHQILACVLFLDSHLLYSGDKCQVDVLLPRLCELVDRCKESESDGLLQALHGPWSRTALNALYAGALQALGRLCRAGKKREEGGHYEQHADRVRAKLQEAWSKERGLFLDRTGGETASQWDNALVLYFDLARQEQKREIAECIRDDEVEAVENLLQTFFLVGGLYRAEMPELAMDLMRNRWACLVQKAGSSWSEKADMGDVSPGPEYYIGAQVIGVHPGAPGGKVLEVRPSYAGLVRASGRLRTARGWVAVSWEKSEKSSMALRVELEEDGETRVFIPRLGLRFPTLTLNGEILWSNEKVYLNSFVQEIHSTGEYVAPVLLRRGIYEFIAQ